MATEMDKEFDTQDLEAQADSILAEAGEVEEIPVIIEKTPPKGKKSAEAEKKAPPLDESVIAALTAAAILNEQEKLRDLFAKAKQRRKLDSSDLLEALDELTLSPEQVDQVYDSLEQLGVEIAASDLPEGDESDDEPPMEALAEVEE